MYSKRGGACFVPHIALAQIFARSALRAGFRLEMTHGFSPRARRSFAPELPAGVVALNEVVDMYFSYNIAETISPPKNADGVNVSLTGDFSGTGYHDKIAYGVASLTGSHAGTGYHDKIAYGVASLTGSHAGTGYHDKIADGVASLTGDFSGTGCHDKIAYGVASLTGSHSGTGYHDKIAYGVASLTGGFSGTGCHDKIADAVDDFSPDVFVNAMNAALPEGFRISRVLFPAEDSPSLGKSCKHAEYLIRHTHGSDLLDTAKCFYGSALLKAEHLDNWIRLIIHQPAQFPIGGFVKHMIAQNIITGWHQVNIVRVSIGIYHQQKDCVSINA